MRQLCDDENMTGGDRPLADADPWAVASSGDDVLYVQHLYHCVLAPGRVPGCPYCPGATAAPPVERTDPAVTAWTAAAGSDSQHPTDEQENRNVSAQ